MQQLTLTPAHRRLLAKMREINYGKLHEFEVRDGELILPEHLTVSKLFGEDLKPSPDWDDETHASTPEVMEVFALFSRHANMLIDMLSFENALPTEIQYVRTLGDKHPLADGCGQEGI